MQVAKISSANVPGTLCKLLQQQPTSTIINSNTLSLHQLSDPDLHPIILYLKENSLPEDNQKAQEVVTLAQQFTMSDEVLYRTSQKQGELPGTNSSTCFTETTNNGGAPC